jgi:dUTP pyrophosphatase
MRLGLKRLTAGAIIPQRAHDADAGLDLCALEAGSLGPGERLAVGTGIAIELPPKTVGLVVPRSGLAARHGISLVNAPGVIDEGYRGEIHVLLLNTDRTATWSFEAGERIAQLLVLRFEAPDVIELEELSETARGDGGFGSTGR